MNILPSQVPKPQLITRHLGGLSAIHNTDIQAVIWRRRLVPELREELADFQRQDEEIHFVSLPDDPLARVRQQLRKANLSAFFLAFDMALLVTVFGELSGASRIAAHLQTGASPQAEGDKGRDGGLRLVAAYDGGQVERARRLASYVAIFRGEWFDDHPLAQCAAGSLRLCLEAAPLPRGAVGRDVAGSSGRSLLD